MKRLIPYICRVCGHLEWLVEGEPLPPDYSCSLCGARASAMKNIDDPVIVRQTVDAECINDGLWCLRKNPRYSREWEHVSYAIRTAAGGLVLFDPPPIFNANVVDVIRSLGEPTHLILSHSDFVGCAQLVKESLGLTVLMGADEPLAGNRVEVDRRVTDILQLGELTLCPLPGHSEGSIGARFSLAGKRVLLAGDALAKWDHADGRVQVSVFQPPGQFSDQLRRALQEETDTFCCCTGWLDDAGAALERLRATQEPSARPYLAEPGGVWQARDGSWRGGEGLV